MDQIKALQVIKGKRREFPFTCFQAGKQVPMDAGCLGCAQFNQAAQHAQIGLRAARVSNETEGDKRALFPIDGPPATLLGTGAGVEFFN